jgi:predicted TPR repeat methyltransferase
MTKPKGHTDFLNDAYALKDQDDLLDFYDQWATDYDHQMLGLGYCSPSDTARLLADHLPDNNAAILDVGCGTGLTSVGLVERGYVNVDGIDISAEMLGRASERGGYQALLLGDLTAPLAIPDETYDGALCSGTFTHGHVGPVAITQVVRVLKPGGLFAFTVHQDLWGTHGFESALGDLAASGRIEVVQQYLGAYYHDSEPEGWYCLIRKLPT